VKPAPFIYEVAESVAGALDLKARHGDEARFLAGGQSLVPAMNFRMARPAVLIDLNPLAELAFVREAPDGVRIGALTRTRAVERDPLVARRLPLLHEAVPNVAHPQIRNRGTIGGNLAHADPASEMPAVVLALGGRLKALSSHGERWIDARDFFTGPLTTALGADELLAEIALPALPDRTGTCFLEVARRQGDYAMMGVAAVATLDASGRCRHASLAYCNAGSTPVLGIKAAQSLIGHPSSEAVFRAAGAAAAAEIDPPGNVHATAVYQRHLAGVLTARALRAAFDRAGRAPDTAAA
jgi:carbon-monoxide dehydrogenase medium subunit